MQPTKAQITDLADRMAAARGKTLRLSPSTAELVVSALRIYALLVRDGEPSRKGAVYQGGLNMILRSEDEVIGRLSSFQDAVSAYDTAITRLPDYHVTLTQGMRTVRDNRKEKPPA